MSLVDQIGPLREDEAGPRYLRLQRLIRQGVEDQRLTPGAALPSERELCEEYSLSRVTIRKAIDGLVEEGLLNRRQGAGTFVADSSAPAPARRVEKSFSLLSSFSEDMRARGRKPHSKWLDRSEGAATPEDVMTLGLSPGARVFRFHRIRYADGKTMALEWAVVPSWALNAPGDVGDSLYAALEVAGHRPTRALQRVRATAFSPDHAQLLGIADGEACLFIERRAFLPDGRAVEVTYCYYRGDAYDLVAELGEL